MVGTAAGGIGVPAERVLRPRPSVSITSAGGRPPADPATAKETKSGPEARTSARSLSYSSGPDADASASRARPIARARSRPARVVRRTWSKPGSKDGVPLQKS